MSTSIHPVVPQPVRIKSASGNYRWIWGPTEPITDMCNGGNSWVSWYEDYNEDFASDALMVAHCDVERPKGAKVEFIYEEAYNRWVWIISTKAKKPTKSKKKGKVAR